MRVDGVDVRDLDPDVLWSTIGLVPQKAYLFTGTVRTQPAVRQARRDRRRDVDGARDRAGHGLRRGDARGPRRPDRPGRHQRVRRPAAAARDRAGAREASRRSTCSTTRSRRSTSPPTPGCVGRSGRSRRRDGADRRAARVDDPRRRPDRRARGRRGRRHGHARRRCCDDLPDVPGDRRVPADARRWREHGHRAVAGATERSAGDDEGDRARRPGSRARSWAVRRRHGRPEVGDFGPSAKRLVAPDAPGASRRPFAVLALAVVSVAFSVLGPWLLGQATDLIFDGLLGRRLPAGETTEEAVARLLLERPATPRRRHRSHERHPRRRRRLRPVGAGARPRPRGLRRRRRWPWLQAYLLNDVVQGTVLPDARGRRGEDQPAAAALLRPAAARRAAVAGHQRHRQRQPDAAADDEPAAHVAAHRRRRARDDVLDLAAARTRRAGRGRRSRCSSPAGS